MRSVLLITVKDLRERVRDRSLFIWGLLAPLGLSFIFSSLFGDLGAGTLDLRYGVVDLDGGEVATGFTDGVVAGVEDAGVATFTTYDDEATARAAVADGDLDGTFVIPQGFSDAVAAGSGATIEVVANVDADIGAEVATAIASSYSERLTSAQVAGAVAATAGVDPAAVARRVAEDPGLVRIGAVDADVRELDATTYLAAGMGVFFLFFTVQFGVLGLLEERRTGTLSRLLVAPVGRGAVYGAKVLTGFVIGVVSLALLVVGTTLLMGADWGPWPGVALLIVAGVFAASGITAIVAANARTAEQAGVWQAIIGVALGMLGGVFFPIAQAGGWLAALSRLTPHQWFLVGLAELRADPSGILPALGALLAFGVVTFGLASVQLRGEGLT